MSLLDLLRLLRKSWKQIAILTLVGGLAGALYTLTLPVTYTAQSTGYLIAATPGTGNTYDAQAATTYAAQRAQQYLPLAETKAVMDEMAAQLEHDPSGATPDKITVTIVPSSNIVHVSSNGPTPEQAQARANAGVRAMSVVIQKMETLNPSAASAAEAGSLDDIPTGGQPSVALVNFEPANLPASPSSPNWPRNILMGLAVGLGLGLLVAVLRKYVDAKVRTSEEVEKLTESSVLGVIPASSELAKQRKDAQRQAEMGIAGEALRKLRTNLRFVSLDNPPRSIVITSANPGEGKSTVAANLARVLADSGQKVILIDCDLRKPMQAKAFHLDGRLGVTQVLTGDVSVADALQDTDYPNLKVLTAGRIPPNPSEIVGSQHMADLIERLSKNHMVIVDAPPLLPVTDAGLLSVAADGTILVVRVGKAIKDQVALAARMIKQVNGTLLGTVINGAMKKNMGEVVYGYGYGKAYGNTSYYYYYSNDGEKKRRKRGKSSGPRRSQEGADTAIPSLAPYSPKRASGPAEPVKAQASANSVSSAEEQPKRGV